MLCGILTGCGGSDSDRLPENEPTRSSSGSLLDRIPDDPPQRPTADRSDEGAAEFSEYVMRTIVYTVATNDTETLESIADLATCGVCQDVVESAREATTVQVSEGDLNLGEATVEGDGEGFYTVRRMIELPSGSRVDPQTGEAGDVLEGVSYETVFNLRWTDDAWQVLRVVYEEPDS